MAPKSWLDIPRGSHFSLANIPFGVVTTPKCSDRHAAIAVGDHVLDLHEFAQHQGFSGLEDSTASLIASFSKPVLNDFAALGQEVHTNVRRYLQEILKYDTRFPSLLKSNVGAKESCLFHKDQVKMHLPMKIAGFSDFFAGKHHAYKCGRILRDPSKALSANYFHLPIAYHSRASSVIVSGTDIRRPLGQFLQNPSDKEPSFGPCSQLDIEVELGALICRGNSLGEAIDVNKADEYIFGFVCLNDWGARDFYSWEAVPLGAFNSKSFATTISAWVILKDALEPFRVKGIENDTKLHPYLQQRTVENVYDMKLETSIRASNGDSGILSRTNGRYLVFSFEQMIAHHTVSGCPLEVGDLIASGTLAGPEPGSFGCFLEGSNGGKQGIDISATMRRTYLEDGDSINIRGWCGEDDLSLVGFGDCEGTILPPIRPAWM
ncbi:fumarylacetoacetase [Exophiala spinifera]|uniref:Fumarylacetoacetase n=1 Tax=Exophiala spinifera TaxID=91928 RepID=A0A0D2B1D7_9EURO|nr:fumarylacetoacetase [Exophiala spinifera]KIW12743.1 fumarylacetoacetase [Exophiala spinifera]